MNTRSLRFQLISWYAALLIGAFALIGAMTYLALQHSLSNALEQTQLRRAREISHLLEAQLSGPEAGAGARFTNEIEESFAPSQNDRFIRISRRDGTELYRSQPPIDRSFDPAAIRQSKWPVNLESSRTVMPGAGGEMIITSRRVEAAGGKSYLVETGAPLAGVQADLKKWLWFLAVVLPALAVIAVGGGYLLMNRALSPVDQITASAERISSHNLSERLPDAHTGDELERLSLALNRMIERLDAAFEHSRQFVADASHELRTPLTVLRGELESLVDEPGMPADWEERLGSALEEVVRLSRIVEGLFAISRLDAGEAAAEWMKFDLGQVAASTADQITLLAEDKRIRISSAASIGIWVEGDRARIKQVVVNLLDNAIKYTPEGGKVTLKVTADDERACLEVADTGIGIPSELLSRVFERFFRVDRARSRELGGAGLGLSIVKSICVAHHGSVEASSSPGKGSVFRVYLPRVSPPAESPESKTTTYAVA
jgi:heavy metal sensor kinase